MNLSDLKELLEKVKNNEIDISTALENLRDLPFKDLGLAKIDTHRQMRTGYPEVIYCAGKSNEQIQKIFEFKLQQNVNILGTRATPEMFSCINKLTKEATYNAQAKTITIQKQPIPLTESYIAVVTAGTSDIAVAEEAAVTAEFFGNKTMRIFDIGVAGIHRLFAHIDKIRNAKVIIAVAGMEGALPGVIGGLVDKPIIAVPTSIGYGANFGGLSALLTMLNSCAAGVSVVNIDNGFGAGYIAGMINHIK